MAYKIKTPKEKEFKQLRKKPFYPQVFRTETRLAFKVPEKTHQVGQVVTYKEQLYMIKRKTDKGIYVSKIKEDKQGFLDVGKKEQFISERKIFEGKVYPYYPLITWGLI